jgi:serine/threonine-protein kinase
MDGFAEGVSLDPCLPIPSGWRHLESLEKIGQGVSGEVYRAWDPLLEREVALKLSRWAGDLSDSCSQRALREARLLARIRHPNVVTVYGADHEYQRLGIWMEYIRGSNLEAVLRQHGPMGASGAAVIGLDLCSAVTAAHDLGLLHGDIKARNVMLESTGRIVLLDFGLSQDLRTLGSKDSACHIRGTPLYMAPEILRGESASARSDIYAIGVLLYRLSTGRYPAEGGTMAEVRDILKRGHAKLLRDMRTDFAEYFVETVDRSLSPEPVARFATVAEMADGLRAALASTASKEERLSATGS